MKIKSENKMDRRNFLQTSGILAAVAGLPQGLVQAQAPMMHNSNPLQPFLIPPIHALDHGGNMAIKTLIRNEMTGGVYSCVACAVAPKVMGPPPHYHLELDELMFVLEGTASVLVEDEEVQVQAGGWHFRPRKLRHTFWNASDQPLRFIDMYFNQNFEVFLERIFYELTAEKGYPMGSEQLKHEHDLLNEKYGLVYAKTAGQERQQIIEKYGLK
jgi:mannose-6-phosphate isomerase-like protein (cupin superfamily)